MNRNDVSKPIPSLIFSDDDVNDPTHSNRGGGGDSGKQFQQSIQAPGGGFTNPFLDVPDNVAAIEYKKGYVMRKCCYDLNNKKSKS